MGRFFISHRASQQRIIRNFDPASLEDVITVREFVSVLEPTDRRIAHLIMAGYTQAEIGSALSLSQQAIAKRLKKISGNPVVKKTLCVGMRMEEHDNVRNH